VTVIAKASDDVSGITRFQMTFKASLQFETVTLTLSSGTALNGTFTGLLTLPRYSEKAVFSCAYNPAIFDAAGRWSESYCRDSAGRTLSFEQTGTPDLTRPRLTRLSVTPSSIDTSASEQRLTVTAHATDDLSGARSATAEYRSPSKGWWRTVELVLDGGTPLDAVLSGQLVLPRYAPIGKWELSDVKVRDARDNIARYDSTSELAFLADAGAGLTFEQVGADDHERPRASLVELTPNTLDRCATPSVVTVSAKLLDGLSGVRSVRVWIYDSSSRSTPVDLTLTAGTANDGTFTGTFTVPRAMAANEYRVTQVDVLDEVGNYGAAYAGDRATLTIR
jgi:hypothetical protein